MAGSKVAQSERGEKSRGAWILLGLLVVVVVMGGAFFGYFLDTTVVNPPAQVQGNCPSPAFITANQCVQRICTTNPQNNQQVCNLMPAGHIVGALP